MTARWMRIGGEVDHDALVDEIKQFLVGTHTTLFGMQESIISPKGNQKMADWLATTIERITAYVPEPLPTVPADTERLPVAISPEGLE